MPIKKVSFEETLGRHILPSKCVGCATCVIVCPFGCLEYADGRPRLVGECKACGVCAQVCPRYSFSMEALEKLTFGRERNPDEEFGIYRRLIAAQTTDVEIGRVCQDGGVVTTLLKYALESGLIDGAALSGISEDEPLKPKPKLALTVGDIISCAGTRYSYSPNMLAFKEGVNMGKKHLALVGTPCQIQAARMIQHSPLKRYANALKLTIGLFCTESFDYKGLVNGLLRGEMGINPEDVEGMNIKGDLMVRLKDGGVRRIPLEKAKKYAWNCSLCGDFSAELADISVGGLGLNGWSLTVVRTEKGEELFDGAVAEGLLRVRAINEDELPYKLLIRLSRLKRRRLANPE